MFYVIAVAVFSVTRTGEPLWPDIALALGGTAIVVLSFAAYVVLRCAVDGTPKSCGIFPFGIGVFLFGSSLAFAAVLVWEVNRSTLRS